MVQNVEKRPPGRPRAYDPEVALRRARDAFSDCGFSGTSLDDLSEFTGMNRPSLYAAFGDKEALYLKTLQDYLDTRRILLGQVLAGGRPVRESLGALFRGVIDQFLQGSRGARGCYLVGTAATEAVTNPRVRQILSASLSDLDRTFRQAFAAARESGELAREADPAALAVAATSLVYSLALRARAGQPRAALQQVADATLELLCPRGHNRAQRTRSR
jgi:TetR/AcrR family transcriptional regulator, copper-responsive repressor